MKRILAAGLVAAFASAVPAPSDFALAQSTDDITLAYAAKRIDLAGRQRTLSQRLAKAAGLMAYDVDFDTSFTQLTQSLQIFEQADDALRNGNQELGLKPERFPNIIMALDKVDEPWANFKEMIEKEIDDGTIDAHDLDEIDEASQQVLKYQNIMVFKLARC